MLDPFCGSGSTGCAAVQEGFVFTLGNPDSYDPLLEAGNLFKAGRIPEENYEGGCVFTTVESAQGFRDTHPVYHGFAVYELAADAVVDWSDPECGCLINPCRIIEKVEERTPPIPVYMNRLVQYVYFILIVCPFFLFPFLGLLFFLWPWNRWSLSKSGWRVTNDSQSW